MTGRVQSLNIVCKHVESNDTYYVDLQPRLGTSETVSSITSVTCADSALTAASAAVLTSQTTITGYERDLAGNTTTVPALLISYDELRLQV